MAPLWHQSFKNVFTAIDHCYNKRVAAYEAKEEYQKNADNSHLNMYFLCFLG